ncbi:MAG: tetratricopeptide repeat protein [Deltaproteobacteria bacterium]|nr:tetratricopeptide repeat protein [Deltaproteobacteria bacterium]
MRELRIFESIPSKRFRPSLAYRAKKQSRIGAHLCRILICIMLLPILLTGCSHSAGGVPATSTFKEANGFCSQGNFQASLDKYGQILKKYPGSADRVLFEMGIIYAHPKNEQKDYQKALECFQRIIREYPGSGYRKDSEMMIFSINNVAIKDKTITTQQRQIETLQQELKSKGNEIIVLQKKLQAFDQKVFAYALQKGSADRILIEKKARRLTLLSKGEVLKTYKIALGGNPIGPKEMQGDNKTPEGTYVIFSRNKNSRYHQSLSISYPNERDKQRAKELGVSPGGDIMIHGMKNGFSWVGDAHTEVDWTQGCIAVTNEEIEEICTLAPNGTVVEIRP